MKKHLPVFFAGFLTALLTVGVGFAAAGDVVFNTVGLMFNGETLCDPGQSYVTESGQAVPNVIVYTDASGGGTTYLPARRIADLMGVEIGWDMPSGCVTIGGSPAVTAPSDTPTPAYTEASVYTPAPETSVTVYITKTGAKYHESWCSSLSRSKISISLDAAQTQGYSPCAKCNPPS